MTVRTTIGKIFLGYMTTAFIGLVGILLQIALAFAVIGFLIHCITG